MQSAAIRASGASRARSRGGAPGRRGAAGAGAAGDVGRCARFPRAARGRTSPPLPSRAKRRPAGAQIVAALTAYLHSLAPTRAVARPQRENRAAWAGCETSRLALLARRSVRRASGGVRSRVGQGCSPSFRHAVVDVSPRPDPRLQEPRRRHSAQGAALHLLLPCEPRRPGRPASLRRPTRPLRGSPRPRLDRQPQRAGLSRQRHHDDDELRAQPPPLRPRRRRVRKRGRRAKRSRPAPPSGVLRLAGPARRRRSGVGQRWQLPRRRGGGPPAMRAGRSRLARPELPHRPTVVAGEALATRDAETHARRRRAPSTRELDAPRRQRPPTPR